MGLFASYDENKVLWILSQELPSGATYDGQFMKGLPNGVGVMRFTDSSRYEGKQASFHHLVNYNLNLQFTIYNLQFTIYNLQFTIYNLQFTIYNLQFTIYYLLFTIYYLLFTIYYLLFTIYYLLFTIYYLQFTIYYIQFCDWYESHEMLQCNCELFLKHFISFLTYKSAH